MHPTVKRLCYAIVVLVLLARAASAGVLNGHASALLSGNEVYLGSKSGSSQLKANVDYAVFAPGVFTGALGTLQQKIPAGATSTFTPTRSSTLAWPSRRFRSAWRPG
jgi:hypothetical protein